MGELSSPRPARSSPPTSTEDFDEKLRDWRDEQSISFASQLVGAGIVHGRLEDVRDPAEFLRDRPNESPPLARDLAEWVLRGRSSISTDPNQRHRVAGFRRLLTADPRDPIAWIDLAREYTVLGKTRHATRAVRAALQLAPNNRFVLRSATRFYLHQGEPERALHLLSQADRAVADPWLVGPAISVASILQRSTRFPKIGRALLAADNHSDWHVNELAASLATLEFENANARAARRLFRRALRKPTENTVAQVRWASDQSVGLDVDPALLELPRTFEAAAWTHHNSAAWEDCLDQAEQWFDDQEFSSRPAILGSYVAAVAMDDHVRSVTLLRKALIANPKNFGLLNNLAYALANLGKFDEAEATLAAINDSGADALPRVLKLATSGLVGFRRGDPKRGIALYSEALAVARDSGRHDLEERVLVFLALECAVSAMPTSNEWVGVAEDVVQRSTDPMLTVLGRKIEAASHGSRSS